MTTLIADVEIDIPEVLEELGIVLTERARGDWVDTLCPFHPEHNPSFSVNLEHGGWIDRHSSETGGLLALVALMLEIDGAAAVAWLREHRAVIHESTAALLARLYKITGGDNEYAESLVRWNEVYEALSLDTMEQYFFDRGFTPATMRQFEVRYDEEDDSLIFPVRDGQANIVGFVRRRIDRGLPLARKYLYPSGFRRTFFPLHLYRGVAPLLVEGPLDAMWLHQNGHANALAMLGADLVQEQRDWLRAHVKQIALCLDNDKAGRQSTKTLVGQLIRNYGVSLVSLPVDVKDIQEVAAERLSEVLATVRPILLPSDL